MTSRAKSAGNIKKPVQVMSISVSPDTIERLDRVCKIVGISRSRMCENLLLVGLDTAEDMKKLGVLQFAVFLRKVNEGIRECLSETERIMEGMKSA